MMRTKQLLLIGLCLLWGWAIPVRGDVSISPFQAEIQNGVLHVTAHAADSSVWTNTQLMIDVDDNAKTGYHAANQDDHGFDVMVEGTTVYQFQGDDPASWSWKQIGQAKRDASGNDLTIGVNLNLLKTMKGSRTAAVLLRGLSTDFQKVIASSSVTTVDLSNGKAKPIDQAATRPASDAAALSATATQEGSDLVLKITAKTTADLNTVLIFFDTDCDTATGFNPPADPHFGFEDVIQGNSLLQHTGAARGDWSWLPLVNVKQSVKGNSEVLRFNASLLKSTRFHMAVWQMSPDWQTRTDFFPHDPPSAMEVKLDGSKLHADATSVDVPQAPRHANADLPARERFKQATSYCCYYGADRVAALSHFDAAILHIPAETPADVKKLSGLGVVTIGYLSVGEDETLRPGNGQGPGGNASWYFDRKQAGKPDRNGVWGSYYANAADPNWRQDCVSQAKKLCGEGAEDYGFDGIFLDTIETVDSYPQSRQGMIQLVADLRAALPDKVIVMNRGFSLLSEESVSSKIDGLMFESFSDSYDFDSKSYIRFAPQDMDSTQAIMVKTVIPAAKKYGLRVLALDYMEADQPDRMQEAFDRAATFGMIPGVAPISLDAVYNTFHLTAHPQAKYLEKMATPESMQITMDADRNGFVAGTIVQPSSCYLGYSPAAVVDGKHDRTGMTWSKAAWASAEEPGETQQLLLIFPRPITGGSLKITFAFDNGQWHPSRNFRVEVSSGNDGDWKTIAHPTDQHEGTFTCVLPDQPFQALRIVQEPGGGSADRPNLMWIGQVERIPA